MLKIPILRGALPGLFFQRLTVVTCWSLWQLLKRHPDDATVMVHMGQLEKKEGMVIHHNFEVFKVKAVFLLMILLFDSSCLYTLPFLISIISESSTLRFSDLVE